jgi:S1-C subfamily serine protease
VGADGVPLVGAFVGIMVRGYGTERAETDADGRFTFALATGGTATLVARDGAGGAAQHRNVGLARGVTSDVGDVRLVSLQQRHEIYARRPFGGIGGAVGPSEHGIAFTAVVADGPLDRAGVQRGDVLLAIDGQSAASGDVRALVLKLRGAEGTSVDLTVWRDGKEETLTVTRETIDAQSSTFK